MKTELIENLKEQFGFKPLEIVANNIDSGVVVIHETPQSEELVYANEEFFRLISMEREEYEKNVKKISRSLMDRDEWEELKKAIFMSKNYKKAYETENVLYRLAGEKIYIGVKVSVVELDKDNGYLLVAIIRDNTKQKETENSVLCEQERNRIVIEHIGLTVIEWNYIDNEFYSSESYDDYEMSKVNQDDLLKNSYKKEIVHSADSRYLKEFFRNIVISKEKSYTNVRLKMKDGSFRWSYVTGASLTNDSGNIERTLLIIMDVDKQHEKRALVESIINSMDGGFAIYRVDENTTCLYYSNRYLQFLGMDGDEVNNLNLHHRFMHEKVCKSDFDRIDRIIQENTKKHIPIVENFRVYTQDGPRWVHMNAFYLRQEGKYPVYAVLFTYPQLESAMYAEVVEDSSTAVLVIEKNDGKIIFTNKAFREIMGFDSETQLVGKKAAQVMKDEKIISYERFESKLTFEEYIEFNTLINNGRYIHVRIRKINWVGKQACICYISDQSIGYNKLQKNKEEL